MVFTEGVSQWPHLFVTRISTVQGTQELIILKIDNDVSKIWHFIHSEILPWLETFQANYGHLMVLLNIYLLHSRCFVCRFLGDKAQLKETCPFHLDIYRDLSKEDLLRADHIIIDLLHLIQIICDVNREVYDVELDRGSVYNLTSL